MVVSPTRLRYIRFRNRMGSVWPLMLAAGVIVGIFIGAVLFYMLWEGWDFLDSFYMVVITLATVGFGEVHPLSKGGEFFTTVLVLLGVGTFTFMIGAFSQILIEGKLPRVWRRRRVQKTVDALSDHYIVCGYGRVGGVVVEEVEAEQLPVVVIERDPAMLAKLAERNILHMEGDATEDQTLLNAGILRAKAVVAAMSNETANVYVVLTARQFNPDLYIVSRTDTEDHIARMKRAGANRVVMPHKIGGLEMAYSVLRPGLHALSEVVWGKEYGLDMEEVKIAPDSTATSMPLREMGISDNYNAMVVAVRRKGSAAVLNPGPDFMVAAGDTLLVVGRREDLLALKGRA